MPRLVLALCLILMGTCLVGCGESAEDKALSTAAPHANDNPGPTKPPERAPGADAILRGRR